MRAEERQRIARMLEQDKEEMNEESRAAAVRDFLRVAEEYFDVNGGLTLTMGKDTHGFAVSVGFRANRVKNFTTLH